MRILGIDYGRRKIGLATSTNEIAEPYGVIKYRYLKKAMAKISEIVKKEKIEILVVGISEGEMEMESHNFASLLRGTLKIPIDTFDETLSTQDAKSLSLKANVKRKKRHSLEDAYAAAVMLQSYLDSNAQN